jgi:hypothetical protein
MKKLMITGGLMGFLIGVVFGLLERSGWPAVIWRACVAACCAGLMLRWWGGIWIKSLQQAYADKMAAAARAESPVTYPPKS